MDDPPERRVADYVASMTDRYAIDLYERIFVPRNWSV
jgi:dGTPase